MSFNKEEIKEMFKIARNAIKYYLDHGLKYYPKTELLKEKRGVFVTLKIENQLRGCIGYVLPIKPLYQGIADNAINAAFFDPRFPPLTKEEFKKIEIEISVLTVPKEIKYNSKEELLEKIKIGRDGLILEYNYNSGLLLPQVPVEEGWNKKEYLDYLCIKAGMEPNCWERLPIKIFKFEAEVFHENKNI